MANIKIVLEDGSEYHGKSFGYEGSASGEVVFCTAMSGYHESLTDPSYKGQILVMTYPLVGNYGVPDEKLENNMSDFFESDTIHVSALVTIDYSEDYSHWSAGKSLDQWMKDCRVPGIYGVDTRALTKRLRENGNMLGKVIYQDWDIPAYNPNDDNLVEKVSCKEKIEYGSGSHRIMLIDCGVQNNVIRNLLAANTTVIRAPWDYDFHADDYDGLLISGGPGDPKKCVATIKNVARALQGDKPVLGIGLGSQIMALAAGADTFKLKYGHRSRNQPVRKVGSQTAIITSQNQGYAINANTLPVDWEPFYVNLNDATNEGIRHKTKPFFSTQFHPEPSGETPDKESMFVIFLEEVRKKVNKF